MSSLHGNHNANIAASLIAEYRPCKGPGEAAISATLLLG